MSPRGILGVAAGIALCATWYYSGRHNISKWFGDASSNFGGWIIVLVIALIVFIAYLILSDKKKINEKEISVLRHYLPLILTALICLALGATIVPIIVNHGIPTSWNWFIHRFSWRGSFNLASVAFALLVIFWRNRKPATPAA